mgnify:CR=1 FL=1
MQPPHHFETVAACTLLQHFHFGGTPPPTGMVRPNAITPTLPTNFDRHQRHCAALSTACITAFGTHCTSLGVLVPIGSQLVFNALAYGRSFSRPQLAVQRTAHPVQSLPRLRGGRSELSRKHTALHCMMIQPTAVCLPGKTQAVAQVQNSG